MVPGKANTDTNKWRALTVVITVICVLLSSCAVKQGIKSLLLQGLATGQTATPSGLKNVFVHPAPVSCLYHLSSQDHFTQKAPRLLPGAFIVTLAGTVYPFLYRAGLPDCVPKRPYYDNRPLGDPLPVFLRYRRLII